MEGGFPGRKVALEHFPSVKSKIGQHPFIGATAGTWKTRSCCTRRGCLRQSLELNDAMGVDSYQISLIMTHRDGFPRLSASTRVARRCGTSQSHGPRLKAMGRPKALGSRRSGRPGESAGVSESLDDPSSAAAALPLRKGGCPTGPAASLHPAHGPGGSPARSLLRHYQRDLV